MSHLGTGELFSLIMNTLGSYELKRECAFDTSTPSISELSPLSLLSATSATHDCCETDQSGRRDDIYTGIMNNVATTFRDRRIMSV